VVRRPAVERALGLIAGAGTLPARMARQARRQGWRVVAFAFDGAAGLEDHADRVIPSRLDALGAMFSGFTAHGLSGALLAGKFSMPDIVRAERDAADRATREVEARAGWRTDGRLLEALTAALAAIGVEVLDQRPFLGDLLVGAGCLSTRQPTGDQRLEIRRGLGLARLLAGAGIGQTVVLRRGAVAAAEAVEGTTEAIRRGTALAGPGAVIVKAVAPHHDYRFDMPVVGLTTIRAAIAGGAAVVALEAGRVLLLDGAEAVAAADAAGLCLVGADDAG
jgi:DUF1009 family protein